MMKKVSLFLAIVMLLTLFASCRFVPETAEELWEKAEETMNDLDSYKMRTTLEMTFYIDAGSKSYAVTASGTVDMIEINSRNDYYYYESTEMQSSVEELEKETSMTSLTVYQDGQLYLANVDEESGVDQHIRGALSAEAFRAHQEKEQESSDMTDGDFADCATKTFEKTEDGDWLLKHSGFTKKAIDKIWEGFDLGDMGDFDIEDVEIVLLIDKNCHIKKVDLELIFTSEDSKNKPEFRMTAEMSDFNKAERITDAIKAEDYEEVDDILLVSELDGMIEDLVEKESGKIEMESKAEYRNNSSVEYCTINYEIKDSGFYYHVLSISGNNTRTIIRYENGEQTVTVLGEGSYTVEEDDEGAKDTVLQLLKQIQYEANQVSNVTKVSDGVYQIDCAALNPSDYDSLFSGTATCGSASKTLTVTVEDGKIKEITSELSALTKRTNYELKYTVKMTVEK